MIIYIAELYPSTHIHKALLPISSIVFKDHVQVHVNLSPITSEKASKKKNVKWISFILSSL